MRSIRTCLAAVLLLACAGQLAVGATPSAGEVIRLANHPALSPDGATLAFDWNGDIWTVPSAGGVARPLTSHPARDSEPKFSPDGKEIAFISDREGSAQVFIMPAEGGAPRQLTFHTAGYALRFPRVVRFRDADKRPEDATTLRELAELFRLQYRSGSSSA